ncbi:MAG: hypothetical protein AAF219_11110 [Myxococcota bacterium]
MIQTEFVQNIALIPQSEVSELPAVVFSTRLLDQDTLQADLQCFCKFDPIFVVGPSSEQLHDSIDDVLIEAGTLDVVTTWHSDGEDLGDIIALIQAFLVQKRVPRLFVVLSSEPSDMRLKNAIETSLG